LGFSLDLSKCAGGGSDDSLAYVSPKTGRAVSVEAGALYKDKLLPLPSFLKANGGKMEDADILLGLQLTGFFLEHWVFAHHTKGLPEARQRLRLRFAERFAKTENLNAGIIRNTDQLGTELYVKEG
jgi:DNA repair protein RecO (recombination protein O)